MDEVSQLERVLYAPCSWINSQRMVIPELFQAPGCQSLLNQMVINHFNLSVDCKSIAPGSLGDTVVKNWTLLTKVAWLLACRYHRASLIYQGEMSGLSKAVQQFCVCPAFSGQPVILGRYVGNNILEMVGLQLLLSLNPWLPEALIQRIPLLFSDSESQLAISSDSPSISILDFKLALQYAKNHHRS